MKRLFVVALFAIPALTAGWIGYSRLARGDPSKAPRALSETVLLEEPWGMVMLTARGERSSEIIGRGGVIPIHFKATHHTTIPGSYQFVVWAVRRGTDEIVAGKEFNAYQMNADERRQDEFIVDLPVPTGSYIVYVELRDLRPVVDRQGNLLEKYLGQGNKVFFASVSE